MTYVDLIYCIQNHCMFNFSSSSDLPPTPVKDEPNVFLKTEDQPKVKY